MHMPVMSGTYVLATARPTLLTPTADVRQIERKRPQRRNHTRRAEPRQPKSAGDHQARAYTRFGLQAGEEHHDLKNWYDPLLFQTQGYHT
jgi:hypothetical protein